MSKPERVGTVTLLASICLTFGVPTSEAIVIRHDVEAALYRAEPETFPSVLSFLWRPEAGVPETTSLSGTLLSHHWVLTAAHGAEEFEQTTLRIEVGGIVYDEVPFDAWHPHPCFDSADTPSDVGLVYFAAPPWPRLDAYPSLQRTPDELGKVIVFVGKGAPGDGLPRRTSLTAPSATRRIRWITPTRCWSASRSIGLRRRRSRCWKASADPATAGAQPSCARR